MSLQDIAEKNREAFSAFNKLKIDRLNGLISPQAKRAIYSIPLLFSVNDKKMPGYVEGLCPIGIKNYTPDNELIKFFLNKYRTSEINYTCEHPFVEMIALIGSAGTIAYNKKSDFDFWICINKTRATQEANILFQKKAVLIQEWVMKESGAETHLFVNDIESIKNNIFAEDDDEAFGTTAGALLMDEFYRSSIIIEGKIPFWWAVPRFASDSQYYEFFNAVPADWRDENFIDIGNLHEISKEDFLGAALFQLIKSLGNPFKSIIKIGVLEKYLNGKETSPLLSHKVKASIQRGSVNALILDSYMLMFSEVYEYYGTTLPTPEILDVLRKNLYLKINPQLSKYSGIQASKNLPYHVVVMFKYVKSWGWDDNKIKELDTFDLWDYNQVIQFWNSVKKFMLLSYQKITASIPTINISERVSTSDIQLLSGKIKAHFSQSDNKIDDHITFKDSTYESIMYIEPIRKGADIAEWRLYKSGNEQRDKTITLKTEKSLIKLIAWTSINRLFDPVFSRIKIQSGYGQLNQNFMLTLLVKISEMYSKGNNIKNEYYLKEPFNLINLIVTGFTDGSPNSKRSIFHIYKTSWGESYIEKYNDNSQIIKILEKVLTGGVISGKSFDDNCAIISDEESIRQFRDLNKFFVEAYQFITSAATGKSLRFVGKIDSNYIKITRTGKNIIFTTHDNAVKLLAAISLKPRKDMLMKFYGDDTWISLLDAVYNLKKENAPIVSYVIKGNHVLIFLINERGNLFTYIKSAQTKEDAIFSLLHFSKYSIKTINNLKILPSINDKCFVFKNEQDRFGKNTFSEESEVMEAKYFSKFKIDKKSVGLKVTIKGISQKDTVYEIMFTDGTTTGPISFSMISTVLSTFKIKGAEIPVLIDAITFTDLKSEDAKLGTTIYFQEKYRIEYILDRL